jgi:methanogenic corrinoid protein MtbC1
MNVSDDDRQAFLELLAEAAERDAILFAVALLNRGVGAQEVLLDLVAACQAEIGRRWARAEWSIAQEHAATYINEQVVAAVASRVPAPASPRGLIVVACVDGEWHSLPARLFAEVLRLHDFEIRFLGASVPGPHLISFLHQHGPDAVAVSCSLPTRLPAAARIITAVQEAGIPVLAGGAGFGPDGRWARRLGADRVARGATEAASELLSWLPATPMSNGHLSAQLDDEHLLIAKRRTELIDAGLERLAERFPLMRSYTPAQHAATAEDLGHLVDFLNASLLVDDVELFTEFIDWMGMVLTSRGVPLSTVEIVVEAFEELLYDYPRALGHLGAGRRRL